MIAGMRKYADACRRMRITLATACHLFRGHDYASSDDGPCSRGPEGAAQRLGYRYSYAPQLLNDNVIARLWLISAYLRAEDVYFDGAFRAILMMR